MLDPEFYQDQIEDGLDLIQQKIKDSKPTNKQIWYWLQAYTSLLVQYASEIKHPSNESIQALHEKVASLSSEVNLLKAKGGVETVRIGKAVLGGAQ